MENLPKYLKNSWARALLAFTFIVSTSVPPRSVNALPSDFPNHLTDGLTVFLDAKAVDVDGGQVTRWIDQSGNENHAYAISPPSPAPVLVAGATPSGQNALAFNGATEHLDIAANPDDYDGRPKTTFVVFKANDLSSLRDLTITAYETNNPANPASQPLYRGHQLFVDSNVASLAGRNRTATDASVFVRSAPAGHVVTGEFYIGSNLWKENGETRVAVVNAAAERFEGVAGTLADALPTGHLLTRIGAGTDFRGPDPMHFFDGEIAAYLHFNRALSDVEMSEIESFLHEVFLNPESGADPNALPPVTNGLVAYLNAANIETSGGRVQQMNDLSGRGNHARAPAVLTDGPTVVSSATPSRQGVLRFDRSVPHYLEIAGNPAAFDGLDKTTLVVFRSLDASNDGRFINSAYTTMDPSNPANEPIYRAYQMFLEGTNQRVRAWNRTATDALVSVNGSSGFVRENEFYLAANYVGPHPQGGDGVSSLILRNEANDREIRSELGVNSNPAGHLFTRIGADSAFRDPRVTLPFHGDIAAVLIYNKALPPWDLDTLENYLYDRYMQPVEFGGYFAWVEEFDLPASLRGPNDDANGDGLPNLVAYALGMNPMENIRPALPTAAILQVDGVGYLGMEIPRNPLAEDVVLMVEVSEDLLEWRSGASEVVTIEDSTTILRVRLSAPVDSKNRQFLRVRMDLE